MNVPELHPFWGIMIFGCLAQIYWFAPRNPLLDIITIVSAVMCVFCLLLWVAVEIAVRWKS